ncbi:MAG: prephenate dehydratase [Acidobacteriota bacterium]
MVAPPVAGRGVRERVGMQHVDLYTFAADAAYQGVPGAFSEEAARALVGADARLMPCATLEQAFDAVTDGRATHAVVPVESAVAGTVPHVYEYLLAHDVVVSGETSINVDYVLVAPPGARLSGIRRVMTHPLALAQCDDFFRSRRGVEAVSAFDTAGAVRIVVEAGDRSVAALASRRAAELYGAAIIAEHIQDVTENWTRFLRVSTRSHAPEQAQGRKAMLACGLKHAPGALVRALQVIADQGLSVTKIEGQPIRNKAFEYRFVVETVAPDGSPLTSAAFDGLGAVTEWFRVLGLYDVGETDVR